MRLATFANGGRVRFGVVDGESVVDVTAVDAALPTELIAFLQLGDRGSDAIARVLAQSPPRIPLEDVHLWAPVPRPGKYLAIGLNYEEHIKEMGRERPSFPVVFNKQTTCVNGPYDDIVRPRESEQLDYEGELAIIIGRTCRRVSESDAPNVIAGYTVANDVSVRDWQRRSPTMIMGKGWDTHGPLGPWLVTPDELGDPHRLDVRTWVNGDLRQESNTRLFLRGCYELIAFLSTMCTLEPGDVIATGTPPGVAAGMNPPGWLQTGDTVKVEIERIGFIENRVVDDVTGP